jgi:hypothetical protein
MRVMFSVGLLIISVEPFLNSNNKTEDLGNEILSKSIFMIISSGPISVIFPTLFVPSKK